MSVARTKGDETKTTVADTLAAQRCVAEGKARVASVTSLPLHALCQSKQPTNLLTKPKLPV